MLTILLILTLAYFTIAFQYNVPKSKSTNSFWTKQRMMNAKPIPVVPISKEQLAKFQLDEFITSLVGEKEEKNEVDFLSLSS